MSHLDKYVTNELLYDNNFLPIIINKWKQTEVDYSAQDYIHEKRVGITIPNVTYKDLYKFAIEEGFIRLLITFELLIQTNDKELLIFLKSLKNNS